ISAPSILPIKQAFNVSAPKNIFNKTIAEDGKIYSYNSGGLQNFANGAVSGRQPVEEGVTYTLWTKNTKSSLSGCVFFWGHGGNYLRLSDPCPCVTRVNGFGVGLSLYPSIIGCYLRLTFTIPAGSGIAYVGFLSWYPYSSHTAEQFADALSEIQ